MNQETSNVQSGAAVDLERVVRLFPRGLPKRRPKDEYIHSTCGCWQCAYCASVKAARKRRDERLQLWDSIKKQPNDPAQRPGTPGAPQT